MSLSVESLQARAEEKVQEYNQLVEQLRAGEQERLVRLGEIQSYQQLIQEAAAEESKAKGAEGDNGRPEAVDPTVVAQAIDAAEASQETVTGVPVEDLPEDPTTE